MILMPDGLGGFIPQYGVFDVLIYDGGGAYTVKRKNLSTWHFDASMRLASAEAALAELVEYRGTGARAARKILAARSTCTASAGRSGK